MDKPVSISGLTRRRHLDGIRIFLFTSVYFCHFGLLQGDYLSRRIAEALSYALPVFFVMSGYLITMLILADKRTSRWRVLKSFYIQRSLRIFPAYYVTLIALALLGWLTYPWYAAFYVYNLKLFFISLPPISEADMNYMLNWQQENLHLWSLSVEEQFYIFFPVLFLFVKERFRLWLFALLIGSAFLVRTWFIFAFDDELFPPTYGHLVFVTLEYFAWGGLFAYLEQRGFLRQWNANICIFVAILLAIGLIGWESYRSLLGPFGQAHPSHWQTLIAPSLGLFIWAFWKLKENHPLARPFTHRWLVFLGKTCYANYLVHIACTIAIVNLYEQMPQLSILPYYVSGYFLSVLTGTLLWYLVERPANRYRASLKEREP